MGKHTTFSNTYFIPTTVAEISRTYFSGVFKFNFWRFGSWQQVLVDDLIPTKDGIPVFTHSKDQNEWWAALMEKAYAK